MSSDMMIVCKEDNSHYDGNGDDKAFFIDECSMGEPWTEFGRWFGGRYCGAPDMIAQITGIKEHNYKKLTTADIAGISKAISTMKIHDDCDKDELEQYLENHIGKHISTENW